MNKTEIFKGGTDELMCGLHTFPVSRLKKKKKKGKERKDSSYGDPETKKMEIREILTLSVSGRFEDP